MIPKRISHLIYDNEKKTIYDIIFQNYSQSATILYFMIQLE